MKHKVLVARATFPDIIERLEAHIDVERNETDTPFAPKELRRRMADKTGALLLGTDRIDQALIDSCPHLRVVSNASVGYDNFDLPAMTRASIIATNAPNLSNESVADLAWGLLISASRRMAESDQFVRAGSWRGFAYNLMLGPASIDAGHRWHGTHRPGDCASRSGLRHERDVLQQNAARAGSGSEESSASCTARHIARRS